MNRRARKFRRRGGVVPLAAACLLALLPAASPARPGDLEPGYSSDGLTQFSLTRGAHSGSPATAWAAPLGYAADGDLIVAGETVYTGSYGGRPIPPPTYPYLAIGHVQPDGELDRSFGIEGAIEHAVQPTGAPGLTLDDNGRLAAVGWGYPYSRAARVLPNGQLDPSFSGDGIADVEVDAQLKAVAVQDDGRMLVGGTTPSISAQQDLVLARLLEDGELDGSFGQNGVVTKNLRDADQVTAIRVDGHDRIVFAGVAGGPLTGVQDAPLVVGRLLPGGDPDPAFSGDGYATFDLAGDEPARNSVLDLELDAQDRPIVLVDSYLLAPAVDRRNIVRLNEVGELDPSFGTGGQRTLDPAPTSLALQDDGRMLLAGTSGRALVMGRLLADGSSDPGFGLSGWAIDYLSPTLGVAGLIAAGNRGIFGGGSSGGLGAVGKFRLDDGPPDDADADGVLDPGDECPGVYAVAEGCPRYSRDITLKRRPKPGKRWRDSIGGTITAGSGLCLADDVLLYRKQHGPDRLIRTVAAGEPLWYTAGGPLWYTQRSGRIARGGDFYARIKPSFDPTIGHCAGARSKTVEIPPLGRR